MNYYPQYIVDYFNALIFTLITTFNFLGNKTKKMT
ncbi:hypothetical protein B879_00673 [Cecembia lonarensis LW9]|uniref:Uncharacterized protein n=1 Tax=Cecembia lonarensis (strain CCUG 58316 / KCTC 22772 / LW9) TaxID=1225176 RepID=K1LK37_CECL9|nr:hypothetical protein B879_00673 [Cecembia lonarensis LW9]